MLILNEKKILENSATYSRDVDKIMTFKEFVIFNNINLDEIFVDKLFHNIDGNLPIYMDETMIGYFGYSGTPKLQKKCVIRLVDENFENVKNQLLHTYSNASYTNYLKNIEGQVSPSKNTDQIYPPAPTGRGTATTKHILVHPKLFKEMLMMCQTKKGKQVRRYYIDMMDTVDIYLKYQTTVALRTKDDKIEQLLLKMDTMINKQDQTLDKLNNSEEKSDNFRKKLNKVLPERVNMSDMQEDDTPHVYILRDKEAELNEHNLYVIRTQQKNYKSSFNKVKSRYNLDQLVKTYTIKQPNAIAFWGTLKKKYAKNIIKDSTSNWFMLENMTLREFKENIKRMDEERRQ
jgi:hypothetical protein